MSRAIGLGAVEVAHGLPLTVGQVITRLPPRMRAWLVGAASRARQPLRSVTYARILDGVHLWCAIEGSPDEQIALRELGRRDLVVLPTGQDQPGVIDTRAGLDELLPGTSEATWEVLVCVGRRVVPLGLAGAVWGDQGHDTTPPHPDGTHRYRLLDTEGRLHLRREPLAPTAVVTALGRRADRLLVECRLPAGADRAALLHNGDAVSELVPIPLEGDSGTVRLEISTTDVPATLRGEMLQLAVSDGRSSWWLLRRRQNSLKGPNAAVPTPWVRVFDGVGPNGVGEPGRGRPRALRLVWGARGMLGLVERIES